MLHAVDIAKLQINGVSVLKKTKFHNATQKKITRGYSTRKKLLIFYILSSIKGEIYWKNYWSRVCCNISINFACFL